MKTAWNYMWNHELLWRVLMQLALILGLIFPMVFTTIRVYLQHKFNLDAKQFGIVFAVPGLGSLMGSLAFLLFAPKNPLKVLPFGIGGLALFLIGVAESQALNLTLVFLGLFSFCMYLALSSLTVTIHMRIENRMRGRISAIIGMAFVSFSPVMSGPIGILSDLVGERVLIEILTGLFLACSGLLAWKDRRARITA